MLGGVIRTLTLGPRLVRAILLLPELLKATQPLGRLVGRLPGGRRGEALP
jgi:hypothetical protein